MFDGPYSLTVSGNRVDDTLLEWADAGSRSARPSSRYFLDNRLNLNLGYTYSDIKIDNIQANALDDAVPGDFYLQTGPGAELR